MFGNDKIAHYGDEQLLCNAAVEKGTAEREWSVYQDVGHIPLCKKCMTKIRKQNRSKERLLKACAKLFIDGRWDGTVYWRGTILELLDYPGERPSDIKDV